MLTSVFEVPTNISIVPFLHFQTTVFIIAATQVANYVVMRIEYHYYYLQQCTWKKKEWKYICTTVKILNSIIIFLQSLEFCELQYFTVGYSLQFIPKLINMDREVFFLSKLKSNNSTRIIWKKETKIFENIFFLAQIEKINSLSIFMGFQINCTPYPTVKL